ncbi:MAG TPA: hypothetical protein ENN76_03150 [Euryarchaeota archaeon]|nr:hypothetical protein [Euryarchaeota archaeon]
MTDSSELLEFTSNRELKFRMNRDLLFSNQRELYFDLNRPLFFDVTRDVEGVRYEGVLFRGRTCLVCNAVVKNEEISCSKCGAEMAKKTPAQSSKERHGRKQVTAQKVARKRK